MNSSSGHIPHHIISPGSGALFFIQIFSTLGFAVLYSTLVLYATKRLGFSEGQADTMMGIFGAFNYGLHLFGGCLGGRYLSNRNLFILGMLLQVAGCYFIAEADISGLWWGLSMFLTGSGLNVTCLNMMLIQRFAPDDDRREGAFLWNYAGMNLGFFIGFSVAGYYQLTESYRALFLFATVGNVMAVLITLFRWPVLADISTPLHRTVGRAFYLRMLFGVVVVSVLVPVLRILLTHAGFSSVFVIVLGGLIFLFLCVITARHHPQTERRRMVAYLILAVGSLVFWSLYQLAPMGLTLFAEHNVRRDIYGWYISPQWIQNINTVVIVTGGPSMAWFFRWLRRRGVRIDIPAQFTSSLFCMGLGMLVTGVASVLAGYVSGRMPQNTSNLPAETDPGYSTVFNYLGWGAVVTGVILLLLIPQLRRLIEQQKTIRGEMPPEV